MLQIIKWEDLSQAEKDYHNAGHPAGDQENCRVCDYENDAQVEYVNDKLSGFADNDIAQSLARARLKKVLKY